MDILWHSRFYKLIPERKKKRSQSHWLRRKISGRTHMATVATIPALRCNQQFPNCATLDFCVQLLAELLAFRLSRVLGFPS
jgi:hypothetical protein